MNPVKLNTKISPKVRVRFAPSPTGYLHVGGARSAFFNYLFAKKNHGDFILRIEDTDQERSTQESLKMVIEDLQWLGLKWDEGPHPETLKDVGPYGPYKQSERLHIYKQVADQLLKSGKAYYCFLTDEEIEQQREMARAQNRSPHVESPYEDWSLEKAQAKIKEGGKAVVRFKTRQLKKDYIFTDLIRGEVTFPSDMVGDFVLLRSDGMPVYNFCCVVDDHMMKITHVLRAEEHLPNSLRQLMIYEAMNWEIPEFGHLSLVLDEDRQKLSKRKGATSCHQFKEEGYLPQALLNFIVLLGWSHPEGKEIVPLEEIIEHFYLDRINPAGAVFDGVKLKWMNSVYLRALNDRQIWEQLEPFIKKEKLNLPNYTEWQDQSVQVFRSYMETLQESVELYRPIDDSQFNIQSEADEVLHWESSKAVLTAWRDLLKASGKETLTGDEFLKFQDQVKDIAKAKGKFLFMPIRVAVIGKPHGTELKILVPLMKVTSLIQRVEKVLEKLG